MTLHVDESQRCSTCPYWKGLPTEADPDNGECRIRSLPGGGAPRDANAWCGEHPLRFQEMETTKEKPRERFDNTNPLFGSDMVPEHRSEEPP